MTEFKTIDVAVIGAGLDGAAAAALLENAGFAVHSFEQAPEFLRFGVGIHVGPNVMKIFGTIGLEDRLSEIGAHPPHWYLRDGHTGEYLSKIPLGDYALKEYCAPYITIHRGDNAHPMVRGLIEATEILTKWPFWNRDPMPLWSRGRLVMLGDACHSMRPHMAQGACMAIEDAAILARALSVTGTEDYKTAFRIYENTRRDRATKVQTISNANTWLKQPEDPTWVYAYDPMHADLREE